ncbi:hypothetical protein KGY79_13100 [Candidatus Bipolaricaulota bacterium]|nr:hypothetical protein [Candidatus Bipolaricaulota bacterium]
MSVKPLSLRFQLGDGETETATLNVHNRGQQPTKVTLRPADWWRTPEGNLQILPPGTRDKSSADWLIFSPAEFELGPDERIEVDVEAAAPEEIDGDHWSMVLVTEEPVNPEESSGMQISVGYAVKILIEDTNKEARDAKITNIKVQNKDPLEVVITFENTGKSYIKTTGMVEVRNLQGETEREFEIKEFPTLPGEEHKITINETEEEDLSPGQYYIIAQMDFGGEHLIQGGIPFEVEQSRTNDKGASQ